MACVGKPISGSDLRSCSEVRAVKIDAKTSEPNYKGPLFETTADHAEPDDRDLKRWVKKFNQEIKKYKRHGIYKEQNNNLTSAILISIAGGFAVYAIGSQMQIDESPDAEPSTGKFMLGWASVMVFAVGVIYALPHPIFPKRGMISEAMADHDGWNWSVKPNTISHRNFYALDRFLELGPQELRINSDLKYRSLNTVSEKTETAPLNFLY